VGGIRLGVRKRRQIEGRRGEKRQRLSGTDEPKQIHIHHLAMTRRLRTKPYGYDRIWERFSTGTPK